jgi:hypothetical protein
MKIKAEIIKIDQKKKKTIQRINETKMWFYEKTNKIGKLANLTEIRREKTQISKTRNKKWEITTNTKEFQGIIRN